MFINKRTTFNFGHMTKAMVWASDMLRRDFEKVFSHFLPVSDNGMITFRMDASLPHPEQYIIKCTGDKCDITYRDELGFIYAVCYISREWLGVPDFWYWTDFEPRKKNGIRVNDDFYYISKPAKVRWRGWFVNDEVCLIGMSRPEYPPKDEIWRMVFETILRAGGNMVIPGTDLPRTGNHFTIASDMGLYITHHHAEPMGADMFLRRYPDKNPSYDENGDLFRKLWRESVDKLCTKRVIWTLGFRGQGDCPFWTNDPKYKDPASRAEVISRVMEDQYNILCRRVKNPVCCVYLYGEITELYQAGYLKIPDNFIKIWADNGYGKMITRRQGNHWSNTEALPAPDSGANGVYYHVTFHDLQASNHLVPMSDDWDIINTELNKVFDRGGSDFLLVNCGNIRPHCVTLHMVSKIWQRGRINTAEETARFCELYMGGSRRTLSALAGYTAHMAAYHSPLGCSDGWGDEIYPHTVRQLVHSRLKNNGKTCASLIWLTGDIPFSEQHMKIKLMMNEQIPVFREYLIECEKTAADSVYFRDCILFAAYVHYNGACGLSALCQALELMEAERYPESFIMLCRSARNFRLIRELMDRSQNGRFEGFYSCDWLTNISAAIYALEALRKYVRMISDGPDLFRWYKNYVLPETERNIYLENTQRETFDDWTLYDKLNEKFDI